MNLRIPAFYLILTAIIMASGLAHAENLTGLSTINHAFCVGDDSTVLALYRDQSQKATFSRRVFGLRNSIIRSEERKKLLPILTNPEKMNPEDRAIAAYLLFSSRSSDFKLIKKLLDYEANENSLHDFILALDSEISFLDGDKQLPHSYANQLTSNSIDDDPDSIVRYLSWARLTNFDVPKPTLASMLKTISNLDEHDQRKGLAEAALERLKNEKSDPRKILDFLRKSYQLCPRAVEIAQEYAFNLYLERKFDDAKPILQEIIKNNQDIYSPHLDLWLADIYAREKDLSNEILNLDRARTAPMYFSRFELMRLMKLSMDYDDALMEQNAKSKRRWFAAILLLALFAMLAQWIYLNKRSKTKNGN